MVLAESLLNLLWISDRAGRMRLIGTISDTRFRRFVSFAAKGSGNLGRLEFMRTILGSILATQVARCFLHSAADGSGAAKVGPRAAIVPTPRTVKASSIPQAFFAINPTFPTTSTS